MLKTLLKFLDLSVDLDKVDEIHQTITNAVSFRGTNLWILVFAIIIASVGLNTNSTAVIIGAMLISPLMGPINGMGYAIATYDFQLFRRALKNFGFAVGASLLTSTLYFLITPISTAHSELLARTSPTIYDVLIALFGGLAGIVAISSRHKGNVIPGVAIATALMPPLCTAGFGLASGQPPFFFGAFYLFTINTVFIGISSVIFSQLLRFPIRTLVDPIQKRQVNRWISIVISVTILPSFYFGYLLVEKEKFTDRANKFVTHIGVVDGSYLLRHEIDPSKQTLKLIYGGDSLSIKNKRDVLVKAVESRLDSSSIVFEQGFSFNTVSEDINEVGNSLRTEINRLNVELRSNIRQKDSVSHSLQLGKNLLREARALFPDVSAISYSSSIQYRLPKKASLSSPDSIRMSLVVVSFSTVHIKTDDKEKIERWLATRLQPKDSLRVLYEHIY